MLRVRKMVLVFASTMQCLTHHTGLCVVNGYTNRFGCVVWLVVSVVYSGRETPGPIPNPEAKPASR